jgi:hypothetical protein
LLSKVKSRQSSIRAKVYKEALEGWSNYSISKRSKRKKEKFQGSAKLATCFIHKLHGRSYGPVAGEATAQAFSL